MKKIFLSVIVLLFSISSFCQPTGITQINVTSATGGINVNVEATWGGVFIYGNHSYSVTDNLINIEICYFTTPLLLETVLTNDFYIPISQANNYTLTVTGYHASSEEICENSTFWDSETTEVLSNQKFNTVANEIFLFPNPCKDFLSIESGNEQLESIEVYDNLGQLIEKHDKNIINIEYLSDGVYTVKIKSKSQVSNRKLIVKK